MLGRLKLSVFVTDMLVSPDPPSAMYLIKNSVSEELLLSGLVLQELDVVMMGVKLTFWGLQGMCGGSNRCWLNEGMKPQRWVPLPQPVHRPLYILMIGRFPVDAMQEGLIPGVATELESAINSLDSEVEAVVEAFSENKEYEATGWDIETQHIVNYRSASKSYYCRTTNGTLTGRGQLHEELSDDSFADIPRFLSISKHRAVKSRVT